MPKVRLIDQNGENVGVVPIEQALESARAADLDLVEVADTADPPVCKIMDLGKFLFEKNKKDRLARKAQTKIEVKEIQLRPKTNVHHRMFKVRDARRWLTSGMKVRVTIKFRGREVTYPEIALNDLKEIAEELKDISSIEAAPSMEGRTMTLVLAPDAGVGKKAAPKAAPKPAETATKPVAEEVAKPAAVPVPEPAAKKAAKPASVPEPAAKKAAKPPAKPAVKKVVAKLAAGESSEEKEKEAGA